MFSILYLREKALPVPQRLAACVDLEPAKAKLLYGILYELLGKLGETKKE